MLDLTAYEGIVFDMDGTLIDTMGSHMQAWEMACHHYGYPFDAAYLHSLGGVPTRKTVVMLNDKYGLNHTPDEVAQFKRTAWENMGLTPGLVPETWAVFKYYRPSMKIGIGTGAERQHAIPLLTHHGILEQLDALVTATDVARGKPHPETFLTVAQKMGVAADKCIVFEDTEIGVQAATNAGMDCLLVKNGKIQQSHLA
jgi:beta-phosphoglucomutase family hydrolase